MKKILVGLQIIPAIALILLIGCEDSQTNATEKENDSTSHAFTFYFDTLGESSGSSLRDITILNDSLAFAVGEMFVRDSIDTTKQTSNAIAKWNGKTWTTMKIYYNNNSLVSEILGIYVLNEKEIYLAAGSIYKWDGQSKNAELVFSRLSLPDPMATIYKLWGNSNNIYGIGQRGTLVFYNGSTWQQLNSGTVLQLNDIWGAVNPLNSEYEILIAASDHALNNGKMIIRINSDQSTNQIIDSGLNWENSGIWFVPNKKYYIAGDGIFLTNEIGMPWESAVNTTTFTTGVRGNNENDIFIAGIQMLLMHFNGASWKKYFPDGNTHFARVAIKNDFMIAVGYSGAKAIVCRGYR
ncbi:MAG: hypothetical protein WCX28_08055 [Bacteriovoracaceae bacterium]|nr:hypothetical protein [Bacteroidota bacterium]